MKTTKIILVLLISVFIGCEKEDVEESDLKFVPTDVFVQVKGDYTINKVFGFINSFEHEVENIHSQAYTSSLPSDSLQYVLDYLNAKPYTNDGHTWFVTGYRHYKTDVITIFPRLFNIKNANYQEDWLQSMKKLKLKEQTENEAAGSVIFFHVPEGKEEEWVKIFEKFEFVEWAELNYLIELNPWP